MKRTILILGAMALVLWVVSGCEEGQKPTNEKPILDTALTELPKETIELPAPGDTAAVDSPITVAPAKSVLFAPETTFPQHFSTLSTLLFEDLYQQDKLAEHEKMPFFSHSRNKQFQRMRIKKPEGNSAGSRIYPRHILKGYQFANAEEAQKTVEGWLNDFEHSGDSFILGQPAKAIKSPPVLVAIKGNEVFMLQTTCLYTEGDWLRIQQLFNQLVREPGVNYVFSIGCNAGELTYQKS